MKNFLFFPTLLFVMLIYACNGKDNKNSNNSSTDGKNSKDKFQDFEKQLTADSIFWQSKYAHSVDFLFKKNGTAISLFNGSEKWTGKWSFNKSTHTLEVAWTGNNQYSAKVDNWEVDWSKIYISGELREYGTDVLKKMTLLDNRFEQ